MKKILKGFATVITLILFSCENSLPDSQSFETFSLIGTWDVKEYVEMECYTFDIVHKFDANGLNRYVYHSDGTLERFYEQNNGVVDSIKGTYDISTINDSIMRVSSSYINTHDVHVETSRSFLIENSNTILFYPSDDEDECFSVPYHSHKIRETARQIRLSN